MLVLQNFFTFCENPEVGILYSLLYCVGTVLQGFGSCALRALHGGRLPAASQAWWTDAECIQGYPLLATPTRRSLQPPPQRPRERRVVGEGLGERRQLSELPKPRAPRSSALVESPPWRSRCPCAPERSRLQTAALRGRNSCYWRPRTRAPLGGDPSAPRSGFYE